MATSTKANPAPTRTLPLRGRLFIPSLARYAVAAAVTALALLITLQVPALADRGPYLLFSIAILLSAWYGGLGPGLLVTFLSIAASVFFFLLPAYRAGSLDLVDWDELAVFALLAFTVTPLTAGRRRAERRVQEERDHLHSIVETIIDGIVTSDEQGTIISFNPAAARIFGYKPEEVIGKNVKLLMPEVYSEKHDGYMASYLSTGEPRVIGIGREGTGRRKDGSVFPIELGLSEFYLGQQRYFTGIVRDISERKHMESEREQLLKLQEAARVAAEEAVEAREQFLKVATHELRSPLTTLLGYADLLTERAAVESPFTKSDLRALQSMSKQALRLDRLISTLFDISRVESGQLEIRPTLIDVGALAGRIVKEVKPQAGRHQLMFTGTAEPLMVQGDGARLVQVFQNLLSNAIKFSPAGGLIRVEATRRDGMAYVAVIDQGIGIPAVEVPHIFDRFYRARNAGELHIDGLGVGLYVAREIVRLHGGDIALDSVQGQGSCFTVRIPLLPTA